MDIRIIVETTFENGKSRTHELGDLSRPVQKSAPENIGLNLENAKTILNQLQKAVLADQFEELTAASRNCPDCNGNRSIHDYRFRVIDSLFGRFKVKLPRYRKCACASETTEPIRGSSSPLAQLIPDRATPELQILQAELGARHSFREAARIIETFLPCAKQSNTTVRNRLGKIAEELVNFDSSEETAVASQPLTVFIDGAHIRCRPEYQKRNLDVVVGKIEGRDISYRFGFAPQAVSSPAKQLRGSLKSLGWDGRKKITVISDGEAALPNLIRNATQRPVRHILDWWHISMRVKHVENAIRGLLQTKNFPGIPVIFSKPAESLRWYLWHGKIQTAGTDLQWLIHDCARMPRDDPAVWVAATKAVSRCLELYSYLENNMSSLTNYGRRYRQGLPISTSRAEGCVDDIGNARMGKRRRMRWSPRGAHNVAVTRAAVLDGRLSVAKPKMAA